MTPVSITELDVPSAISETPPEYTPTSTTDYSKVYIYPDGTIEPASAPIRRVGDTYELTGDVNAELVVQKSNILIDGKGYTVTGTDRNVGKGVYLNGLSNVIPRNIHVSNFFHSISISGCSFFMVADNYLENQVNGIVLDHGCYNNSVSGNTINGTRYNSLFLGDCAGNEISNNIIINTAHVLDSYEASENRIIMNTVVSYGTLGFRFPSDCHDNIIYRNEGSFLNDLHKDLRADYLLANPPFNDSDWSGDQLREDPRWKYGTPPEGNANFAWVQHFVYHLAPKGIAGFVLANGSMSSNTSNEGEIRKNLVEADLVDCMVALPSQLFYNTMIPVCLWFISRDRKNKFRDRREEVLFIDARNMGTMIDRRHRQLTEDDIKKISDTYHKWRGEPIDGKKVEYKDVAGFCKSATLKQIRKHDHILTPGRYVGYEEEEEDPEDFQKKMEQLTAELEEQMKEAKKLDKEILRNLENIGYEG